MLLGGVVYIEEVVDEDKDESITEGEGNGFGGGAGDGEGGGRGGCWERPCDEFAIAAGIDASPDETTKAAAWEEKRVAVAASLYLYFSISALTACSSACKDWTCCCRADIAPMHP